MEISRIQELDEVLKIIAAHGNAETSSLPVIPQRYIDIELKRKGLDLKGHHLTAILAKLLMDKYISNDKKMVEGMSQTQYVYDEVAYDEKSKMTVRNIDPRTIKLENIKEDLYWATWEGLHFMEVLNGYQGEKNREDLNNKRIERQAKLTNRFALWAMIGAVGIFIVELFKIAIAIFDWIFKWFY